MDDDPLMLRTLARLVRDLPIQAEFAASAAEALARMSQSAPSALITDHQMPQTTGLELVLQVRQLYPGVRCFLHTGSALSAHELPTDLPVLQKPMSPDRLRGLIESLAATSSEPS